MNLNLNELKENSFGDKYYPEINHAWFENKSSTEVFLNHYKEMLATDEGLFIIVGSESGLLYNFLRQLKAKPSLKFIVIDFDEVIDKVGLSRYKNLQKGSVKLVGEDFDFNLLEGEYDNFILRKKVQLLSSIAVLDAEHGTPYNKFFSEVYERFNGFYKFQLVSQSALQFEQPRLLNAADNLVPLIDFKDKLSGLTGVILAGGPTLDDAIDWVKQNREKLVVFAVGRIANRMKKENIKPDFFVSVDPQDISFDNAKGMMSFYEDSVLIHTYHINPKLLAQWRGLSSYIGLKYGWENKDYRVNVPAMGPTVTNSALVAAFSLGLSQIVFCGVDLCYSDGRTHESSSDEVKNNAYVKFANSSYTLLTNTGDLANTNPNLLKSRDTLEEQVIFYSSTHKDLKFYSTGKYSAAMKLVEYLPADEIPIRSQEAQKCQLIDDIKKTLSFTMQQRLDYAIKTKQEISGQKERFRDIKDQADQALELLPKLYNDGATAPKYKVLNKVEKLRKKVNRLIGHDGDYLFSFDSSMFADTFQHVEDESNLSSDEVVTQLSGFFKGVRDSCKMIDQLFDLATDRAQLRIDELQGEVMPTKLYKQWARWNEFGRSLMWLDWHDEQTLDAEERECLAAAQQKYQQALEAKKTRMAQKLTQVLDDPEFLVRGLTGFLLKKSLEGLQSYVEFAQKDTEKHTTLLVLLDGVEHEIKGEPKSAAEQYQQVEDPNYKQFALKRLLAIAMDDLDHQQALVYLEQLCRYSLDYMLPYADLLDLIGQKPMSIQVLQLYLQQHPDSVPAYLKLLPKLIELGYVDDARWVISQVDSLDPGNQTAQYYLQQLDS